jgi:hypothetical protein
MPTKKMRIVKVTDTGVEEPEEHSEPEVPVTEKELPPPAEAENEEEEDDEEEDEEEEEEEEPKEPKKAKRAMTPARRAALEKANAARIRKRGEAVEAKKQNENQFLDQKISDIMDKHLEKLTAIYSKKPRMVSSAPKPPVKRRKKEITPELYEESRDDYRQKYKPQYVQEPVYEPNHLPQQSMMKKLIFGR